jgi:hypothetical protein
MNSVTQVRHDPPCCAATWVVITVTCTPVMKVHNLVRAQPQCGMRN